MKMQKLLLGIASCAMLLTSCGSDSNQSSIPEKWQYTREDVSSFDQASGTITVSDDGIVSYTVETGFDFLTRELTKDDVILYDTDALAEKLKTSGKEYADYEVVKSAALNLDGVTTEEDKTGFTLNFAQNQATHYSALISKEAIYNSAFLLVEEKVEEGEPSEDDPQLEWEKKYVESSLTSKEYSFAIDMIKNIAYILIGCESTPINPTALVQGLAGVFSQFTSLCDTSPTIQDVLNKLDVMDKKIDGISKKIDYNTTQLAAEAVRIEAGVDQARLDTLGNAITTFANEGTSKINQWNRDLEDVLNKAYKDYVANSRSVTLNLVKDENGAWTALDLMNTSTPAVTFTLNISSFPKAKEFLSSHNQKVSNGFMDAFNADLDSAIASASLPVGLSKSNCRQFVSGMIIETLNHDYYKANPNKAQEYRDLVINYADRISGANGGVSIVSTYLERLELMYNFGAEIKDSFLSIVAGLMETLDINVARAAQSCSYTDDIGPSDLKDRYEKARSFLADKYKFVKNDMKDSYSFTTQCNLAGNFFNCLYNVDYKNRGNNPTLLTSFGFYSYSSTGDYFNEDSLQNYNTLSAIEHKRITTRWGLLKSQGLVGSEDYIHYLASCGAVESRAINGYNSWVNMKRIGTDSYRILTCDRNERDLNDGDKSISFYCQSKGNLSADYFTLGNRYNYASYQESSCWSGRITEATFVDAGSGNASTNQRLCAWASYAESHTYWSNDEYWAFQDNPYHAFFFMVNKV